MWNKQIETMSRRDMVALQAERLRHTINNVYENVPFYRQRLDEAGIKPETIKGIGDLPRIPFTTKDDLRAHYPYGLFARPMNKIVRIHASSGTTGKPTVVGYTRADLEMWSECVARLVVMGGAHEGDIAQVSFGYGLFTGALGLHQGLERIGASVVPISSGNTEKQLMIMQDFGVTVLIATPSYALYMAESAAESGMDMSRLKLRLGLFGAEGATEEMYTELEKRWGITATTNYGLSEIVGPGVSGECQYKEGMHINEDNFIVEIVNPDTLEPLGWGEMGEVVITTINKEGLPLLRYRTRDVAALTPEICRCGRTSARMSRIKGRTDDMLIIKGVNVFPSQVEAVLLGMDGVGPHYQLVVTKKGFVDALEVKVELIDNSLLDRFSELERLEARIHAQLKSLLGLESKVSLVEPKSIERSVGKAKRVIDLR